VIVAEHRCEPPVVYEKRCVEIEAGRDIVAELGRTQADRIDAAVVDFRIDTSANRLHFSELVELALHAVEESLITRFQFQFRSCEPPHRLTRVQAGPRILEQARGGRTVAASRALGKFTLDQFQRGAWRRQWFRFRRYNAAGPTRRAAIQSRIRPGLPLRRGVQRPDNTG